MGWGGDGGLEEKYVAAGITKLFLNRRDLVSKNDDVVFFFFF